jgi:hypothetical protein
MYTRTRASHRDYVLWFSLVFAAIFLISFILYPLTASLFDFERSHNEGWNAFHQTDAIHHQLYHNKSQYVFANYTPLSFLIVGALSKFGDPIMIGRIISIASFAAITLLVGLVSRRLGSSRAEALFGTVVCIGLLGAHHRTYIGINDPQMFGSTVALAGLHIYVSSKRISPIRNTFTLSVLLIAGLIKQTLFAIPIAIVVDLILRDRREGAKFLVHGLLMGIVAVLILYLSYGSAFFEQILSPREYSFHEAATETLSYPVVASAALPLTIAFLAIYARYGANRFVLTLLLATLSAGTVLSGGAGTITNMFIDFNIALSIASAAVLRCLREDLHADRRLIAVAALLSIYGPAIQIPYGIEQLRDGLSGSLSASQTQFHQDVKFMANYPGEAFCDSPMLCFRAGRDVFLDPFNASQAIRLGKADPSLLLEKVGCGEFAVIQLATVRGGFHSFGPPLTGGPDVEREFHLALALRYRLARRSERGVFYVPQ